MSGRLAHLFQAVENVVQLEHLDFQSRLQSKDWVLGSNGAVYFRCFWEVRGKIFTL
jgi:hypothetical protein